MKGKNIRSQVFKCGICGNVVEVLTGGTSSLVCCEVNMKLQNENSEDASTEKHIPILINEGKSIRIVVGSILHPMEEGHYIEWIEVINGDYVNRKYLKPGDKPEASFCLCVPKTKDLIVRAYCNLHGLWRGKPVEMID